MGIVKRSRDKQDERNVWIEVTEAGWALRDKASHVPVQFFCNSGISPEEGMELHQRMHALLAQLHSLSPAEPGPHQEQE
ncbi:Organic hydroperoxide resistance transcriptional regulator [compost metagenome]